MQEILISIAAIKQKIFIQRFMVPPFNNNTLFSPSFLLIAYLLLKNIEVATLSKMLIIFRGNGHYNRCFWGILDIFLTDSCFS